MHLVENWRTLLRRAWSIRLMLLASLLSGAEVMLPFIGEALMPRGAFAVLSFSITAAALFARLVAQKGIANGDE